MENRLKEMVSSIVWEIFEDTLPEILTNVILKDYQDDLERADYNYKLKVDAIENYLKEFSFNYVAPDDDDE